MDATAHVGFVAASYAAGIVVVAALIAWVALDYRIQRRILSELETQGLTRRSAATRESAAQAAREDA